MPHRFPRAVLALSLACWMAAAQGADPASPVVRTEAQMKAVLASGQPTPLDALTPYGKRRFLQQMQWSDRGLGSFGYASLVRELDPPQIAAIMAMIDASELSPVRGRDFSTPPLRLPAPSADAEARLVQLERFRDAESRRRAEKGKPVSLADVAPLERRYKKLFGGRMTENQLRQLDLGDLPLYFDATALVAQGRYGSVASRHMMLVYEELRARGVDTRRTIDDTVLEGLLSAREFAQAKAFVSTRPHLARRTIPAVHDPLGPGFAGRSVYRYDAAQTSLTREALPYPAGTELVMIVDAGCGFSANALAALSGDAELRDRLLKANLTLVTPPRSSIAFGFVGEWNDANPSIPMRIPYKLAEWKSVDVEGVPQFYLLKKGQVVGQLSGWPLEGNKAALLALLDRAGR